MVIVHLKRSTRVPSREGKEKNQSRESEHDQSRDEDDEGLLRGRKSRPSVLSRANHFLWTPLDCCFARNQPARTIPPKQNARFAPYAPARIRTRRVLVHSEAAVRIPKCRAPEVHMIVRFSILAGDGSSGKRRRPQGSTYPCSRIRISTRSSKRLRTSRAGRRETSCPSTSP